MTDSLPCEMPVPPEPKQKPPILRIIGWSVGAGMLAFCCYAGWYGFFDPDHDIDDLLHSNAIGVSVFMTLIILVPCLVAWTGGGSGYRLVGGIVAVMMAGAALVAWDGYHRAAGLDVDGIQVLARVDRILPLQCGKGGGCIAGIEYSFRPKGRAQTVEGYDSLSANIGYPATIYASALSTHSLWIVYDPLDPGRSIINDGYIARRASPSVALQFFLTVSGIFLGMGCVLGFFAWLAILRKRLDEAASKD